MYAKSGTVGKMAHAWDDGGKEADRTEVLEAPAASEEDSAADRVEGLGGSGGFGEGQCGGPG